MCAGEGWKKDNGREVLYLYGRGPIARRRIQKTERKEDGGRDGHIKEGLGGRDEGKKKIKAVGRGEIIKRKTKADLENITRNATNRKIRMTQKRNGKGVGWRLSQKIGQWESGGIFGRQFGSLICRGDLSLEGRESTRRARTVANGWEKEKKGGGRALLGNRSIISTKEKKNWDIGPAP